MCLGCNQNELFVVRACLQHLLQTSSCNKRAAAQKQIHTFRNCGLSKNGTKNLMFKKYFSGCDKGRRCVDVATGGLHRQIKSLWPGHGVTSQYFDFEPPAFALNQQLQQESSSSNSTGKESHLVSKSVL